MSKPSPKPIHIFRAGAHTAMQGQQLSFSEADLATSASAYNPELHEAPLVIGHPAGNAPAYGWVSALAANGEGLFATPRQVEPQFAEAVSEGRFKKVSASFYAPGSPHNPVPGVYYLRHVGFLGAQPPAVKGLAPVEFADGGTGEDGVVTLEFAEEDPANLIRRMAGLFRSLRDYFIDKEGLEKADAIIPSWAADWLQEDSAVAASKQAPAFHEPKPQPEEKTMPETDPVPTGIPPTGGTAADQARLQSLEKQLASFQEQQRRTHAQGVINTALGEGRLTPAQTTGLVDFMAQLSDADGTLSFGEGDNAHKTSPLAFITGFIASLPKQVDFSEHSVDQHTVDGLTPEAAAREALCYQEGLRQKGITISVTDAIAAVKAGTHKEASRG